MTEFLEISTGYELSPLSAQFLEIMLCQPYKEGLTFEPLLKQIFATKLELKIIYFVLDVNEELPWYVKQFAKKLEYFDQDDTKNVYYIDSNDILPKVNISKATMKDEDVLEGFITHTVPEYPHDVSKVLRGLETAMLFLYSKNFWRILS